MLENFESTFQSWLAKCQEIINNHYALNLTNLTPPILTIKQGSKFIKIVSVDAGRTSGSAWAFINKENGDVMKPATFKAPAKHSRGNIFDENNGMAGVSPYGPAYLRG